MPFGIETFVENASNLFGMGNKLKDREREENLESYKQQEFHGIQSRVEGAKAAGLHPLAALGYQSGPGPTSVIGGTNVDAGAFDAAFAPKARQPVVDQEMRDAELRLRNAQASKLEADVFDMQYGSNRALATQPGNAPGLPTDPDNVVPGTTNNLIRGVKVVPNEIKSSIDGREVGVHPSVNTIRLPGGMGKMTGLSSEVLKQTEDMELARTVALILANKDRIGKFVTDDIPWSVKGYAQDIGKWLSNWRDRANAGRKGTRGSIGSR